MFSMMDKNGSSFGIDVITNSIKDFQQEKAKNERMLSEVRSKRRSLEGKYEAALSAFNQASETRAKMHDTLKVAQYKVSQSQAAIESQHNVNQDMEQRIRHIKTTIKDEESRQEEEIGLLEGKLASLTEMFHTSKNFYLDKSLKDEISVAKNEVQNIAAKVNQTDTEADRLVGLFEALEIVAKKHEKDKASLPIPLEVQHEVFTLFECEAKIEEQDLKDKSDMERRLLSQLEE